MDYLDRAKQYGETPWIPLETFRELMGIAEEMYPEFKKLNKWVIKLPIRRTKSPKAEFLGGELWGA